MQGLGTKVIFLVFVLLAVFAVASVMNSPEFQHIHFANPGWF
jgi:hypothetical protein